ncbi:MAG: amylo-alpha-1,6-glucosidase [archaeon]
MLDEAYDKSKEVIRVCSTKKGLFASGGIKGYRGVWARDSMISLIGASLAGDEFKEIFKKSLVTLEENQSNHGQIPNAVIGRKADYKSIDSSLWFIIGEYIYRKRYKDNSLFNSHKKAIEKALTWLEYQDMGEDSMLEQLPTSDWQDAFPHRYGHTINTQALYYEVLNLAGKRRKARKLRKRVNKNEDDKLWGNEYYYSYRWKNHNKYKEIGDWFDSLGNLLAIIFGVADRKQASKILNYIEKKKINKPYPMKAIYPPINRESKHWQDYYIDCAAGNPNSYLNGGIWTFIGGFYVLALVKMGKFREAEQELKKLAECNLRGNFPEWIHPITKRNYGELQAWSAGMYIAAYKSLKMGKVLI